MSEYQVIKFNESLKEEFLDFCRRSSEEKSQPASVNMWSESWYDEKNTLPYIVLKSDRFKEPRGDLFLIYKNKKIVGCSGVYISDFSNQVSLSGVRTWIIPEERHLKLPREYLLPVQKQWSIDRNLKIIALTFNDYNKNMISLWKRMRFGEHRSLREPKHIFYNGLNEVEFPVKIQYTKQWVIYEKLDNDFYFDWSSIKWIDR